MGESASCKQDETPDARRTRRDRRGRECRLLERAQRAGFQPVRPALVPWGSPRTPWRSSPLHAHARCRYQRLVKHRTRCRRRCPGLTTRGLMWHPFDDELNARHATISFDGRHRRLARARPAAANAKASPSGRGPLVARYSLGVSIYGHDRDRRRFPSTPPRGLKPSARRGGPRSNYPGSRREGPNALQPTLGHLDRHRRNLGARSRARDAERCARRASQSLPADLIVLVTDAHGELSTWYHPSTGQRLPAEPALTLLLIKEAWRPQARGKSS